MNGPQEQAEPIKLDAPTSQPNVVWPSKELELTMALKRYEFERYIKRLKKVPSPTIAVMLALATLFAGGGFGFWAAAYVAGKSTTTVEAGTAGILWVFAGAMFLVALICTASGWLLRKERLDQLKDIIEEMEFTLKSYPWEKGEPNS